MKEAKKREKKDTKGNGKKKKKKKKKGFLRHSVWVTSGILTSLTGLVNFFVSQLTFFHLVTREIIGIN